MTTLTQRRMAGATAIMVLLFAMQAVVSVPAAGVEDTTCQKVEGADLGVEGLQVTVDGHVDVTFYDWVGTPNEFSAVTVDVAGLLANEDLVWSTKAGSAQGGTLETNDGVIPEDGTYTIGRGPDAIRGISHITLCVVETAETPTTNTTTPEVTVTTPEVTVTTPEVTATSSEVTVTTAAPDAEVLGATITVPAEVTSDTLPFTGAAPGGLAVGGLLALIAGMATLGLSPRESDLEGTWSNS